jgi:uncharacterized protein YjbI with pentapeptide repeats
MSTPRPTYANVTATLALFVALGGSAYAAATVTGRDVRNGTLTGSDVKNNSLRGADIRNRSLRAADFRAGALPRRTAGVVSRRTQVSVPDDETRPAKVSCAPGETAVGGGAGFGGAVVDDRIITFSEPLEADGTLPEDGDKASQWSAAGVNLTGTGDPITLTVQVLCAR